MVLMNPQAIIRQKRDGGRLTRKQLDAFVTGAVDGSWSNGQIGAMLMALFTRGMDPGETASLLEFMMASGERLTMTDIDRPVVDKHSTGGVGDKVSLVLAPLAAACGLAVPMLSGRGLGHTGGTLDKLESIPGFNVFLTKEEIFRQVSEIGCVIAGQTADIVPADKILYAMRDETATVEDISLISASILSKKLVEGIGALLLDVKFGRGAFMKDAAAAESLARTMVDLGNSMGCRTAAWLTCMDTPLGQAVGNAVEVTECIAMLSNSGPDELRDLIVEQVAGLLELTGRFEERDEARQHAQAKLESGEALDKFAAMVAAQGGDRRIVKDPSLLPQSRHVVDIHYEDPGRMYVADVDAMAIAEVVLDAGGGRRNAEDTVDHACGITHLPAVGDEFRAGDILARLHHGDPQREAGWIERIRNAITLSETAVAVPSRILKEIK